MVITRYSGGLKQMPEVDLSQMVPPPPPAPQEVLGKVGEAAGNVLELPIKLADGVKSGIDGLLGGIRDFAENGVNLARRPPGA